MSSTAATTPTPTSPPIFTEADYASTIIHGRSLYPPLIHPVSHTPTPAALLHLRAYTPAPLALFSHFALHAASALAIPTSPHPVMLPTQRTLWTVPRGPFVHKKSQENFKRVVHRRAIKAWDADPEVVGRWIAYLVKHRMPGVGMRFTRWEGAPVGVGENVFGEVEGALRKPHAQRVQALADKIVLESLEQPEH
ncbi:ribosomal protein S10 domain-containing protein [Hygrophoropsis aurantiaca]|uniref:Ribosomal protein S10 domain-containing protein n=1 Tax=Hygrophoropsis aurantiaca TaxID=72124 RepID=A0ACB7ZUZ6_9AGAM|nr:ribosomal protein S10 domain-containing protein [Hygrophoropsis aurantiaca]